MVNATLAWHFLGDDGKMRDRKTIVKAGETYRVEPPLELCEVGLHASLRAFDALQYAPGSLVCRVEVGGEIIHGHDKLCASERKVLWMANATHTLHEFSPWSAEWILDKLEATGKYKIDPRSRAAIDAKRRWLKGEVSGAELAAAESAAWDAAGLAAGTAARAAAGTAARAAARSAAWAAARAAARSAAEAAARSAAEAAARAAAWDAAWAAARAAAWDEMNAKLEEMLLAPARVP